MLDLIIFFAVVLIALFVTGLFFYGLWKLIYGFFTQPRVQAVVQEALQLVRETLNPILRSGPYHWEQESVMNPGAVEIGGKTHLFYRAIGADGVSRIGYASSKDGVNFDDRLPYPVYSLSSSGPDRAYMEANYPDLLASGGSWGGCEDPRAVIIDDRLYLSFSAFYGWHSLRIGVVSIAVQDFLKKQWNWSRPAFLSPSDQVHKNWVLFPEKIRNQFAILHSISPNVEIAYRNKLQDVGSSEQYVDSPRGARNQGREGHWDNWVRGAGAPPIKTAFGWLLFYHATDREHFGHQYRLGAMLLDLLDPTKILARSPAPILIPETNYENDGKPGVVYACGATVKDDTLHVYYGGGDKVVCAATAHLPTFLNTLMNYGTPSMARV
ncbi:MAG: hypothetical protein JWL88_18 [Parcubacteria group bacterium]|nr:hypothetical protein [Parcubacteria group bacterium]